ncbi:unnamed protein product [Phaedon cochleariae]|uniref:Heparan-alpha-glucosaminide N-acetyltransferase catalytic domain-containing protein n=1 Tax=Phaedon cochleariae TaxID=80249 RepID=A0A9P0DY65_PHACE|nr:unnamed protein product [Phaedon cochleariae]
MLFDNLSKCLQENPKLLYDEACVDIFNYLNHSITIYHQYTECHLCNFQPLTTIEANSSTSIVAKTTSDLQFNYTTDNGFCSYQQLLYEHYQYGWNITEECSPMYIKEPADNAYLPILMAFVILFSFGTVWYMIKFVYRNSERLRRLIVWNSEIEHDLGSSTSGTPLIFERQPIIPRKHPQRIKSIDVFRGLCITVMIFVNYGGAQYWFFKHSTWNGITIADLVFPWFLWLMGLSLTVSVQNKLRSLVPRRLMIFQVIRRSLILLLLGLILNSNKNMSTIAELRFPGVLQRLGLTYLVVGLLEVVFTKRTEIEDVSLLQDITSAWRQWLVVISLTAVHTSVTLMAEVPGCPRGYMGPGGLDMNGRFFNCTGGVAGYIDRAIFGNHMYKHAACQRVYENTEFYDPEGILGTLTSILTVYLGVQAGRTSNTYQNVKSKMIRWNIWGISIGLIGGILCLFKRDDGPIPLNKQLWSLSFTLVTAGMAFIIQAYLFLLVDILKKWGGRPLFYPGMNAIALYLGHDLLKDTFPFGWKPTEDTHATFLFMNLWGTFLWVAISIYLYKHNIFLTI